MKKGVYLIISIVITLFFFNITSLSAESVSKTDVVVKNTTQSTQYYKTLDAKLEIQFLDSTFYNDKVFVSYHIYDENNELLDWEGTRYPITNYVDSTGYVEFQIDLTPYEQDKIKVEFDMVDEKNVYWFSTNDKINMDIESLLYEHNIMKQRIDKLLNPIKNSPIIFAINVIAFIAFLVLLYKFRKSDLFRKS